MKNRYVKKIICIAVVAAISVNATGMPVYAIEPRETVEEAGEEIVDEFGGETDEGSFEGSIDETGYEIVEGFVGESDAEIVEESGEETQPVEFAEPDIEFPEDFEGMVDECPSEVESYDSQEDNDVLLGENDYPLLDITGTYYTLPADTILNQLNRIRLEAYNEGLTTSYVPLKWSSTIEAAARKRAMEAGLTVAHSRLDGGDIYEYMGYGTRFWSVAEDLAWNNNHDSSGITYGINQFYSEKSEYLKELKGQSHGVTGHYTSIINPKYEYVGVGGCQMSGAPNGWFAVALQLGGNPQETIDETKDNTTGKVTNTLGVSGDKVSSLTINGPDKVKKGGSGSYSLSGKLTIPSAKYTATASFTVPAEQDRNVKWRTSDTSVATVSSNGTVNGVGGGNATLYATLGKYTQYTASKVITVGVPISDMNLYCDALAPGALNDRTFEVNRDTFVKGTVTAGFLPEEATDNKTVTWKSSNTKVVTIDSKGEFKLLKAGTADITATVKTSDTANPTITKKFTLKVKVPVTGIKLNKESAVLNYTSSKAPTVQLTTSFIPSDSEGGIAVIYVSADPAIATVSDKGLVTAVAGGKTTITAKAGTFEKQCEIEVKAPVKGIAADRSDVRLYTTQSGTDFSAILTPLYTSNKTVTFRSGDTSVFTVSDGENAGSAEVVITAVNGIATVKLNRVAAQSGSAKLLMISENTKIKKEIEVVIAKPSENFEIHSAGISGDVTGTAVNANAGESFEFTCEITPEDSYDKTIEWSSSDTGVATIKKTGQNSAVITCVGKGSATITCTNYNAPTPIERSFTANGDIPPYSVWLNRSSIGLYEGETYDLKSKVLPEGTGEGIVFSSSNTSVITVDDSGKIEAKRKGTAVVTASFAGAYPASCTVTVLQTSVTAGDVPFDGESTDGVWVAKNSFKDSLEYTGEKLTQPELRVYYGKKLLKEKTDYTLSYKNNTNVAEPTSKYPPYVTVSLKGQYQGSRTYKFAITAANINGCTENGQLTLIYNKKKQNPVPELYYNGKKLANKTDFTCTYPDPDYIGIGDHVIHVTGKGNFREARDVTFRIVDKDQSIAKSTITVVPADPLAKKIYFKNGITAGDLKVTVKLGGKEVSPEYYDVTGLPGKVGKGTVTIAANDNGRANHIYGYKIVSITTYPDRLMKDVTISGLQESMAYDLTSVASNGGMVQSAQLKYGEDVLDEGKDYKVSYSGNTKNGTAKVTYSGLGRYSGSVTRKYSITLYAGEITVSHSPEITFTKGGVTPSVRVTDHKGCVLNPKTDYSVTILSKSNLKPGTMQFKVVGKGNFKGYDSGVLTTTIKKGDLKKASMTLSDMAYVTKGTKWKSSVKIYDTNGKALSSGKDYSSNIIYSYDGISSNQVPPAGTIVYVTVVGINDYAGSYLTGSYRVFKDNISKLTFVIDNMQYTGEAVEPKPGTNIHVYPSARDAKNKTNEITDYVYSVTGYSSNINSGTGKVTLQGRGGYGGTKTYSFKITKGSFN